MKFNAKYETKEIRESLAKDINKRLVLEDPLSNLREILAKSLSQQDLWVVGCRLGRMSLWPALNGLVSLSDNNNDSLKQWSNYVDLEWYSMSWRIHAIKVIKNGGSIISRDILLIFFLLLGFNRVAEAMWVGDNIYQSIYQHISHPVVYKLQEISEADLDCQLVSDEDSRNINKSGIKAFSQSPICGLAVKLWEILTGKRDPQEVIPEPWPQCQIYEGFFQFWNDRQKLEDAIFEACNYHLRRTKPDRRIHHDIPEFALPPYRQIPLEILAYRNVRKRMGLETPWPAHPLLDSPFVKNLPDELPPSDDPLLKEVLAAVRRILPDV